MNQSDLNTEFVHGEGECPICKQTVHVVGDRMHQRARWVCTRCKTVGLMSFVGDHERARVQGVFAPATA